MTCIDQLAEYFDDDPGLWEGKTNYWDIINTQAVYTLINYVDNALYQKLEEIINN